MKKVILIAALIILAETIYSQTFQKGNRFTHHVITVTLAPNVTMDQYLDFFKNEIIPVYEKNYQGVKVYLTEGIRGECGNCYGFITAYKSKTGWEKYHNLDGSSTDLGKASFEKMNHVIDELGKLGVNKDRNTTWDIQ